MERPFSHAARSPVLTPNLSLFTYYDAATRNSQTFEQDSGGKDLFIKLEKDYEDVEGDIGDQVSMVQDFGDSRLAKVP